MLGTLACLTAGLFLACSPQGEGILSGSRDRAKTGPVDLRIDVSATPTPISPLVYGTNVSERFLELGDALTMGRSSGNRYSTYNWETNASNAGFHDNQENSDQLIVYGGSSDPAAPVVMDVERAHGVGASHIVTVPMLGWVAADTNGVVLPWDPLESTCRHASLSIL